MLIASTKESERKSEGEVCVIANKRAGFLSILDELPD